MRGAELLVIVAVAVISTLPSMLTTPKLDYDSASYLGRVTLTGERLPVVPLLYALLRRDLVAIVVVQALVGALCWGYLAYQALLVTRRPACYVAFVGVLVLSCTDYVTHWYSAILSDSLSLSLLALLLGSLASWLAHRGSLLRVVVVALLWAGTRDTNGYVLLVCGVVGLVLVLLSHRRPAELVAAGVAIAGGVAVIASTDAGSLWQQPFFHVVTERVLVSPSMTAFFAAHGMPVTPALRHLAGPYDLASDNALHHSPALAGFRAWMGQAGGRTYLEYAALHPGWVLSGTFGAHQELNYRQLDFYGGTPAHPVVPAAVRGLLLTYRQTILLTLTGLAAVVLVVRRRALGGLRRAVGWWGAVVLTGYLGLVLAWVGDSWEIGRHSVGPTVQVAVGLVFVLSLALGAVAPEIPDPPEDRAAETPSGRPSVVDQAVPATTVALG